MKRGSGSAKGRAAAVLLALGVVPACSHLPAMHWPWHHHPAAPAAPVHELDITAAGGAPASLPQYWKRNTLVVDLSSVSGAGAITLAPAAGAAWPARLALRITPGAIGLIEVRADQRLSLPVTPAAGKPVELELVPRLYTARTRQMSVSWGPSSEPAP